MIYRVQTYSRARTFMNLHIFLVSIIVYLINIKNNSRADRLIFLSLRSVCSLDYNICDKYIYFFLIIRIVSGDSTIII